MEKIIATLCYAISNGKILLGYKKKGFGQGKWNGFGGKLKSNEILIKAAKRELNEESGIKANKLERVGRLDFVFPHKPEDNHLVYVFKCSDYKGEPLESEEMKPRWFSFNGIPYHLCWDDDRYWLPLLLAGKKFIGKFIFDENNKVIDQKLKIVEKFPK